MRTLRFVLILIGSVVALLAMAFTISATLAQDATATPNPGIPTLLPACDAYYVTADSANIRACAAAGCGIVSQLPRNSMLCVLGPADTDRWFQVDLAPEDPSSPISYVSADVVAHGMPNVAVDANSCQPYLVDGDAKTVYSCPGETCNALGSIPNEGWLCAQDYASQYPGWLYVVYSDPDLVGWTQNTGLKVGPPMANTNTQASSGVHPTYTSEPAELAAAATATRLPSGPTVTPNGPIVLTGSQSVCQQYHVSADQAEARTCAGLDCDVAQTLKKDDTLCVRGITDNPEWVIVDLEPDNLTSPLYAVQLSEIAPGLPDVSCEPWKVVAPVDANVRTCASLTCQVLGSVNNGDWVCARQFGGAYEDWVMVDIPGGRTGVWISASAIRPLAVAGTPTPAAFTPTGSMNCQDYTANVRANVRSCPSTDCGVVGKIEQGASICVYGPAPSAETTWYMVDLTPNDTSDPVSFISQNLVSAAAPGSGTPTLTPAASDTPSAPPTITPTPTPFVTLLPTPIVAPAAAQAPTTPILSKETVLSTLRVRDFTLVSPRGSNRFRFQIPDDWYMDGNTVLYLNIEYSENQYSIAPGAPDVPLTSMMEVRVDDTLVSSVTLDRTITGQQTLAIPIPAALMLDPERRSHVVDMVLQAEDHCLINSEARVFVRADMSFFHFEFRELPPVLDLARYPRPFYNERFADDPESVLVVLPLDPQDVDMQAASRLSAGLGYLTGKNLQIRVVTAEDITADERQNNNLLLVGQLGTNPLIDNMYSKGLFNTKLDSSGSLSVNGQAVDDTYGVVDMALNPDNAMRAVVAVTGKNPDALLKAAQALAGPPSLMGLGGPVALVQATRPVVRPPAGTVINTNMTFTDLGYPEITMNGIGVIMADIEFYMPLGQRLTGDAYVDILYTYPDLLQNGKTTLAVILNDKTPLASEVLGGTGTSGSSMTPMAPNHLKAWIPPTGIIPGQLNTLTVVLDVQGDWGCYPPDSSVAWFSISGDSTLSLPREISNDAFAAPLVGWFPIPFNVRPDLSDVWISLPDNPTRDEMEQAFGFAAMLGSSVVNGEGLSPVVHAGQIPSGTDLSAYHFIVVGRPTTNSFLKMLNANLPQPFVDGSDQLQQTLDDVTYQLPPGYEVGVLEVLPSPWSPAHLVLVVTGSGAASQQNAANALLQELYSRSELLGNVIFVGDKTVTAIDTRQIDEQVALTTLVPQMGTESAMQPTEMPTQQVTSTPGPTLTPLPTQTPGPSATPSPIFTATLLPTVASPVPTLVPVTAEQAQPADPSTPGWLPILLAMTGGVVVIAAVFGVAQSFRRGRGV